MLYKIPARAIFAALAIASIALLVAAYAAQYGPQKQQPCPFCILQRYTFMVFALVSLFAAVHGPGRVGTAVYAAANALCATVGVTFAGWQLTKVGAAESCLADPVGDFVNTLPGANWWPEYLYATGGCGTKLPPILGLTVPVWSLLWFSVFAALSLLILATTWRRKK